MSLSKDLNTIGISTRPVYRHEVSKTASMKSNLQYFHCILSANRLDLKTRTVILTNSTKLKFSDARKLHQLFQHNIRILELPQEEHLKNQCSIGNLFS